MVFEHRVRLNETMESGDEIWFSPGDLISRLVIVTNDHVGLVAKSMTY